MGCCGARKQKIYSDQTLLNNQMLLESDDDVHLRNFQLFLLHYSLNNSDNVSTKKYFLSHYANFHKTIPTTKFNEKSD